MKIPATTISLSRVAPAISPDISPEFLGSGARPDSGSAPPPAPPPAPLRAPGRVRAELCRRPRVQAASPQEPRIATTQSNRQPMPAPMPAPMLAKATGASNMAASWPIGIQAAIRPITSGWLRTEALALASRWPQIAMKAKPIPSSPRPSRTSKPLSGRHRTSRLPRIDNPSAPSVGTKGPRRASKRPNTIDSSRPATA